jgi:hypothetical protein
MGKQTEAHLMALCAHSDRKLREPSTAAFEKR